MKRWDLLLVAGLVLAVIAAAGLDWRLGGAVAAVGLIAVWYWLGEPEED